MKLMEITNHWTRDNIIYVVFGTLLVVLAALYPHFIVQYPKFINWQTIATITGLIIVTTGIEQSALLDGFTIYMVNRSKNELFLAMRLVLLTLVLSAFVTNDISLFIVIPITLRIQKFIKNDIKKIIVFEAIAANVGSALTPIGNPQNIYLFHVWHIGVWEFIVSMLPVFAVLISVIFVFVLFAFGKSPLHLSEENTERRNKNTPLFLTSFIFIALYFLLMSRAVYIYILLLLIIFVYLIFFRDVFKDSDFMLILLFCLMFIDFNVISRIPIIKSAVYALNLKNTKTLFLFSAFMSQIMSNVPASVFVSAYSSNYRIIAYGVNVGGNGLIIGSLANIIAMRLSKKNIFGEFHKYSVPFLVITAIIVCIIL